MKIVREIKKTNYAKSFRIYGQNSNLDLDSN